ncbi:MAG: hypothetical protein ABR521_01120 [Gaiellaceae bacterium]
MRISAPATRPFNTPFALLAVLAVLAVPSTASAAEFTNSTPITINPNGPATPYPSTITPTGLTGTVSKVTLSLNAFEHTFIADVDVLLVAPDGTAMVPMSDMCTFFQTTAPNDFTFDDEGLEPAPPTLCFVTLQPLKPFNNVGDLPTLCAMDPDVFPTPAPPGPSAGGYPSGPQFLSVFNGMEASVAMGDWQLYVSDDCLDAGKISGGWTLNLTMDSPTAVTVASFSARAIASAVELSWRTASETGFAGFNVFRRGPSGTVKVNRGLIAARGGMFGETYRLVDRSARAGARYTYRLQAVHMDGSRTSHRSVRVAARR